MKERQGGNFNRLSKYRVEICQLFIMVLLFLFVFNNELVVCVKDFIASLPIGAGLVESIAVKGYFTIKILASSPSLFLFTFVLLQLMIATYAIKLWTVIFAHPFVYVKDDIVLEDSAVNLGKIVDTVCECVDMRMLL